VSNIIETGIDINTIVARRKPETFEEYCKITGITEEIIGEKAFNIIKNWFAKADITTIKDILK